MLDRDWLVDYNFRTSRWCTARLMAMCASALHRHAARELWYSWMLARAFAISAMVRMILGCE
jgi:hypothetical protein